MTTAQLEANYSWRKGGSLADNPYPKDSKEYQEYMWEMARLQNDEQREWCKEVGL